MYQIVYKAILIIFLFLFRKLNDAEHAHQDLLMNKSRLEHDLKIKSNSLYIDREKCLSSRKSFPVAKFKLWNCNERLVYGWQKILENITCGHGHQDWIYWIYHKWLKATSDKSNIFTSIKYKLSGKERIKS